MIFSNSPRLTGFGFLFLFPGLTGAGFCFSQPGLTGAALIFSLIEFDDANKQHETGVIQQYSGGTDKMSVEVHKKEFEVHVNLKNIIFVFPDNGNKNQ